MLMHKVCPCTVLNVSLACMESLYTSITSEKLFLRSLSLSNGSAPCWSEEGRRDPPLKIRLQTEHAVAHLFAMCLISVCDDDRSDIVLGDGTWNEYLGLIIGRATLQEPWCAPAYSSARTTHLRVEKCTPALPAWPEECSALCRGIAG